MARARIDHAAQILRADVAQIDKVTDAIGAHPTAPSTGSMARMLLA